MIDVDRGGKITWHGPGQLVGYPIVKLADPVDVVDYVRRLEEALIHVCDRSGVRSGRVEGRSGVWLPADERGPERKIAAIGIRVQRGVTMHGFEINCNADLAAFDTHHAVRHPRRGRHVPVVRTADRTSAWKRSCRWRATPSSRPWKASCR